MNFFRNYCKFAPRFLMFKAHHSSKIIGPHIIIYMKMLEKITSCIPNMMLGDYFLFEDVLGRSKKMPFEFFQDWNVSRKPLETHFLTSIDVQCLSQQILQKLSRKLL